MSIAETAARPVYSSILGLPLRLRPTPMIDSSPVAELCTLTVIDKLVQVADKWLAGSDVHHPSQCHAW
jgi:hypothetical protein